MSVTRMGKALFLFQCTSVCLSSHFCLQYRPQCLFWTMENTGSNTCNPCDEATEEPYFCCDTPCIVIFSFCPFLLLNLVKHFGKHKRIEVLFPVFQKPCKEIGTLDAGSHVHIKFIFIFLLSSETRFQVTT